MVVECSRSNDTINPAHYSAVNKQKEDLAEKSGGNREIHVARRSSNHEGEPKRSVSGSEGSVEREGDKKGNMSPSLLDPFPKIKPYTVVDLSTMAELTSLEVEQCLRDAKMLENVDYNCNETKLLEDSGDAVLDDPVLPPKRAQQRKASASLLSMPTELRTNGTTQEEDEAAFRSRAFTAPASYSALPNANTQSDCLDGNKKPVLLRSISRPSHAPPAPPLLQSQASDDTTSLLSDSSSCQSLSTIAIDNTSMTSSEKADTHSAVLDPGADDVDPSSEQNDITPTTIIDAAASDPDIASKSRSYSMSAIQDRPLPLVYHGGMRLASPQVSPDSTASLVLPWLSLGSSTEGSYVPSSGRLPDDELPTTHFYDDIDDVRRKAKEHRLADRRQSDLQPAHGRYDSVADGGATPTDVHLNVDCTSTSDEAPSLPERPCQRAEGKAESSPSSSTSSSDHVTSSSACANDKIIQRSKLSRLLKKISSKRKEDGERKSKGKAQTPEPIRRNSSQMVHSGSSQAELLGTPLQNRRKFPISFSLRGKHESKRHQQRQRSHTMDAIASSLISTKMAKSESCNLNNKVMDAGGGVDARVSRSTTHIPTDRRSSMTTAEMTNLVTSLSPSLGRRFSLVDTRAADEPPYANFPFSRVSLLPPAKPLRAHSSDPPCSSSQISATPTETDRPCNDPVFEDGGLPPDWSSQVQLSMARLSQKIPECNLPTRDCCANDREAGSPTISCADRNPISKAAQQPISSPVTSPRSSSSSSWHSPAWPVLGFDNTASCPLDSFQTLIDAHKETVHRISASACVTCDCASVESVPYAQFHPIGQQIPLDYDEYVVFPVKASAGHGTNGRTYTAWQQECGTSELRKLCNSISEKLILQSTHPTVMHVCCLKRNPSQAASGGQTHGYLYLSSQQPQDTLQHFVESSQDLHNRDAETYEREVCRVLLQVCCGIAYVRSQGIKSYPLNSRSIVILAGGSHGGRSTRAVQVALNCLPLLSDCQSSCNLDDEVSTLHHVGCLLYELLHLSSYTVPEHNRYSEVPTIPMRSIYSHGLKNIASSIVKSPSSLDYISGLLQTLLFGPGDLRHLPLDMAQITTEKWVDRRCVEIVTEILKDFSAVPPQGSRAVDPSAALNLHKIHLECKFLTDLSPDEILKASLIVWN